MVLGGGSVLQLYVNSFAKVATHVRMVVESFIFLFWGANLVIYILSLWGLCSFEFFEVMSHVADTGFDSLYS